MLRSFLQRCPACRTRKPMERMCVELLRIRLPQSPRKRGETRRRSGYGARSPMVLSEGIRRRTRSSPRSSIRNPGWLHASAGCLRLGIDPNAPIHDLRLECRNLLRKRRRRTSRFRQILITVPGASHASVDDLAFSQRTILVAAHIRNRGDLPVKFEDGDTLAAHFSGMLSTEQASTNPLSTGFSFFRSTSRSRDPAARCKLKTVTNPAPVATASTGLVSDCSKPNVTWPIKRAYAT